MKIVLLQIIAAILIAVNLGWSVGAGETQGIGWTVAGLITNIIVVALGLWRLRK